MQELWQGAVKWQEALLGLLSPERRVPPERLSISDLEKLVAARAEKHCLLLATGVDLLERAPLIGCSGIARGLEGMAAQARSMQDFEVMVLEVLQLYEDKEGTAWQVGLQEGWWEVDVARLRALDLKLQHAIVRSLPAGLLEANRGRGTDNSLSL